MSSEPSLADLYRFAQASLSTLMRGLTGEQLARPVPALPTWTVRDTISHVAGIPDDAFNGRMDGAPGEAWTAAQLDRWRDTPVDVLLDQWDAQASSFADVIEQIAESRPPMDCQSHEHDLRGALGLPGNRANLVISFAVVQMLAELSIGRPLTVRFTDRTSIVGGAPDGQPITLSGVTEFEIFRSRLGRRSRRQVEAYDWSDDPTSVLDHWFLFGPAAGAVIE